MAELILHSPFYFYGTNIFWLSTLEDDELGTTFENIASSGVKVVRTWAFDDVAKRPSSGNYLQVCSSSLLYRCSFMHSYRSYMVEHL